MIKKDIFCKNWGNANEGFSYQEALTKKEAVDDAYGVELPNSKWSPSIIEQEPVKSGYRVVIKRKNFMDNDKDTKADILVRADVYVHF